MVLAARLVLIQRRPVSMVADQGKVVAFAALNGIRDRRPTDHESLVQDAWQVSQLLQFANESSPEVVGDLGSELEQHCQPMIKIRLCCRVGAGHLPICTIVMFAECVSSLGQIYLHFGLVNLIGQRLLSSDLSRRRGWSVAGRREASGGAQSEPTVA